MLGAREKTFKRRQIKSGKQDGGVIEHSLEAFYRCHYLWILKDLDSSFN